MDIKKELVIDASVSRVYDAITDMKQLSQWFPDVVSLDLKIGGKIIFAFAGPSPGVSDILEGKIIELEKNKKLSYVWSHPDVTNFPLMKVSWNLEQVGENKTRIVVVHSGFVDENTMNSYDRRWLWITKNLDIFAASEKSASMKRQIASVMSLVSICLISTAIIATFQNSDEFVTGYLWLSLLVVSLVSIPFINKYKKFSWRDKPMVTSVGITILAQIIVTVYWGFTFGDATIPLIERLKIDAVLFYPLMISLLPIGFGISYMALRFTCKSKIIQGTDLVTIQISERKINGLLVGLVAFQAFLNVVTYSLLTL